VLILYSKKTNPLKISTIIGAGGFINYSKKKQTKTKKIMNRKLLMSLFLMFSLVVQVLAQDRIVTGKVTSGEDGSALPGVTVSVKGTSKGSTSIADGTYKISVPNQAILIFSFVGFSKQEVSVGSRTQINVEMKSDVSDLEEVVVVGYGTAKKQNLTSSQANVSGKSLENRPAGLSTDNLLQGKAAGVQVSTLSGRPTSSAFIRIRGESTLTAGSQPLIVIDGVPVANSEGAAGAGNVNILNTINPNDIEDIQVLKDASSASIYGSRGANGVLLITTKQGKKGLPKITYGFQTGYSERTPDNFKLMTLEEKLQYEKDLGFANDYIQTYMDDKGYADIADVPQGELTKLWGELKGSETDWGKTLLRKAQLTTHRVGISGATDAFSYNFSAQNANAEGLAKGSDSYVKAVRLNTEYRGAKWIKTGLNIQFANVKTNELRDRYNVQNPFYAIYTYNPYEPERNSDGSFNLTHQGFSISEAIENNTEILKINAGSGSAFVAVTPVKDIELRSQIGSYFGSTSREYFLKPNSILDQYVGDPNARGSKTDNGAVNFNYVFTNTVTYTKSINNTHNFKGLGGIEFTKDQVSTYALTSKGFPSDKVSTQDNASTPVSATTFKADWALYSLFGRMNYDYNQTYFMDMSIRRDGSSRFGINNRYGTFGAISGGVHLEKLSFMQDLTWLSSLKIRASYGTAGNDRIGNYTSLGLLRYNSYGLTSATFPSQVPNSDLTWEKQASTDIGVDFAILKNRISGTVDFYNKESSSLLFDRPLSRTTGFQTRTENIGAVKNSGIEMALSYKVIQTKDFTFDLSANYSINTNKVVTLTEDDIIRTGGLTKIKIGEAIDTYYMVRYAGVDPTNGKQQFLNKDGVITNTYSAGDAVLLAGKSRLATRFGNVNATINYKGIGLSADVYYSGGNYVMNYQYQELTSDGENVISNNAADALNYWKKAGDTGVLPDPKQLYQSFNTDRYLQKGDFFRLRNVTLSYNLPSKILSKAKIQNLRIYGQAQNWLYFGTEMKGDPEVGFGTAESTGGQTFGLFKGFSYPQTRQLTFGVDITF
jgi:TonB-linked SusC/RagA family outer membrane protein